MKIIKDRSAIPFFIAGLSLLVIIIPFLLLFSSLPGQLPLFYSLPWGEMQLASKPQLLILPAVILLTSLVNGATIWHLHFSQAVVKRILLSSIIATSLIITTAAIKIITIFI